MMNKRLSCMLVILALCQALQGLFRVRTGSGWEQVLAASCRKTRWSRRKARRMIMNIIYSL
jgi:hypothetical protein